MAETIFTDVLVIGAGGAAARAAVEAAVSGVRVDLVDKGKFGESGTSTPCLSGLATTLNKEDNLQLFFQDWIYSGGYISDQNLVWEAINHTYEAVEELEAIGMLFLTESDGSRMLYRGAGHRVARGLTVKFHGPAHPNVITLLRKEAENRGVHIHEGIMVTRLLLSNRQVIGAIGITQKGDFYVFSAKAIILAAGGANRIYPNFAAEINDSKYRTTGDAFNLAFAAGAPIIDMEFAQFRDSPPGAARFGGRYLNAVGERFMERYDPEALEKAPRHKVVEAIYREIKAGRSPIMWEVEGIKEQEIDWSFAQQYAGKQRAEVSIDFQRLLGGAKINERAETPVLGLFAAGESSGGVQGGGRLQGNGFLETQVFGANAGRNAAVLALNTERRKITSAGLQEEKTRITSIYGDIEPIELVNIVQKTMWDQVGVVRSGADLRNALAKFKQLKKDIAIHLSGRDIFTALEACNLLLTAEMVVTAALAREETRGSQIRSDYPALDDKNWLKHVCINNRDGEIAISTLPVVTRLT